MNYDIILAVIFYLILYLLFAIFRNKFEVQNKFFILYKTKIGLKLMDKLGKKWPKVLDVIGFFSVLTGFLGMGLIFWVLIKGTFTLVKGYFAGTEIVPVLSPVLPGVKIAGLPVLSFVHWIIAILLIATVHEFCHGIYARRHNVKIKSSGFAFMGPLLAAFVEPDEKQLAKKKNYAQLQVLAAGPFSNILTAGLILLLTLFILNPIGASVAKDVGIVIVAIDKNMPIINSHLGVGMSIDAINEYAIKNRADLLKELEKYKPNDRVYVKSNDTTYAVVLGTNPATGKAMLGASVSPISSSKVLDWFNELFFWLFAISLGVGLFNLLPLGPVDGGRMFYLAMFSIFKKEEIAKKLYLFATSVCLFLIVVNLLPFVIKFFTWLIGLVF